ncbi:unnamed protein product [Lactuca saligna]|uniref:Uncharacterized protein n=1 Tax=Lactuca saligna TaxID=75948 RepID=A0AA36EPT3_LACSI|nr:unnamed protein product [Lactuca saligna]
MNGYTQCYLHGEKYLTLEIGQCSNLISPQHVGPSSNIETVQHINNDFSDYHRYEEMVIDSMHQPETSYYQQTPQHPNLEAQNFYKVLKQASEPLWDGCTKTSTLSATTRLLDWKSQSNVSDTSFDTLLLIVKDILLTGEKLPNSFYETKKMLKPLKLPSERIHVCINHCMLFRGQFADLDHCAVCGENIYKAKGIKVPNLVMTYMPIGPRLQRLFYSRKTAKHLTWHADHLVDPEKMIDPSEVLIIQTRLPILREKRYFAGDHENLEYCSLTAKEAHEMYLQEMVKKHGEDSSNHKDDARVDRSRAQVSTMEQQQQQMKEQMEMVMRMMNMSGNQPRAPLDNPAEDN